MMKFIAGILLALLVAPSVHARKTKGCLDRRDVQELEEEFEWESKNEKFKEWDLCDSSNLTYKTFSALIYMKSLKFNQTTFGPLQTNVIGRSPYEYFKDRVKKIVFQPNSDHDCNPTKKNNVIVWGFLAYARPDDRSMNICEFAETLSQISLVKMFVHEARHLDGSKFNHIVCEQGNFSSSAQKNCDESLEDNGAYAIGIEFNRKFFSTTTINPALRQEARNQSVIDLYSRFNKLPLGITSGALLQDYQGTLTHFDGKKWIPVSEGNKNEMLSRHWEWPMLFDFTFSAVKPLLLTNNSVARTNAPKFENNLNRALKQITFPEIIDAYNGMYASCYLAKDRVVCTPADGDVYKLDLKEIHPVKLFTSSSSLVASTDSIYILDDKGLLHQIPDDVSELLKATEESLPIKKTLLPALRIDAWKNNRENLIVLSLDGKIGFANATERKYTPIPMLQNQKFKEMYSPFFYSPKLRDL